MLGLSTSCWRSPKKLPAICQKVSPWKVKFFYGEAPPGGPTPLPLIFRFDRKRYPFVFLLLQKVALLHTYACKHRNCSKSPNKEVFLGLSTSCSRFPKKLPAISQKVVQKRSKVAFCNESCSKVALFLYLVWCKNMQIAQHKWDF